MSDNTGKQGEKQTDRENAHENEGEITANKNQKFSEVCEEFNGDLLRNSNFVLL